MSDLTNSADKLQELLNDNEASFEDLVREQRRVRIALAKLCLNYLRQGQLKLGGFFVPRRSLAPGTTAEITIDTWTGKIQVEGGQPALSDWPGLWRYIRFVLANKLPGQAPEPEDVTGNEKVHDWGTSEISTPPSNASQVRASVRDDIQAIALLDKLVLAAPWAKRGMTPQELAGEIGISRETLSKAAVAAGISSRPKRGEHGKRYFPHDIKRIAEARRELGAKATELELWSEMLGVLGMPPIGFPMPAKAKQNGMKSNF